MLKMFVCFEETKFRILDPKNSLLTKKNFFFAPSNNQININYMQGEAQVDLFLK